MSLFDHIKFEPHPIGNGLQGKIFLPNGYGLSVVRFKIPTFNEGPAQYASYCDDETWEVVILKGVPEKWELCYDTEISTDVIGYQNEEDINRILKKLRRIY
jgi:hypothetical protein